MKNIAFVIWALGMAVEMDWITTVREHWGLPPISEGAKAIALLVWIAVAYLLYERH